MRILLFMLSLGMCATSFAGDKQAEHREWMRQAMEKETSRAKDSVAHHGNVERFEKKFGWAKEKQAAKFKAMMDANQQAEKAWQDVLTKAKTTKNPEDLTNIKNKAADASGNAYLAEIALKLAAGADNRKDMLQKASSTELSIIVRNLDKNEADLFKAHKAKHEATMELKDLEQENRILNQALKQAYENARKSGKR